MQDIASYSGNNTSQPLNGEETQNCAQGSSPWILNPLLDYLFVAGGMLWILWGLSALGASAKNDPTSMVYGAILFLGSLLVSDVHGPATLARVYTSATTPDKTRKLVTLAAIFFIALGLPCLFNQGFAAIFTKITLLWGVQHYTAQTYGVVMIYSMKRKFNLEPFERLVVQNLLRAQILFVWTRACTYKEYGSLNFMGLDIPFWGPLPIGFLIFSQFALVLMMIAFVLTFAYRFYTERRLLPLPAILSIVSVISLTFIARDNFNYLIGVIFYHASQYLAITYSYYLRELALKRAEANPKDPPPGLRDMFFSRPSLLYYGSILLIGLFITFLLPKGIAYFGISFTLALCVVYSVFNCHHYLADSFIWRIRDEKVRRLLV